MRGIGETGIRPVCVIVGRYLGLKQPGPPPSECTFSYLPAGEPLLWDPDRPEGNLGVPARAGYSLSYQIARHFFKAIGLNVERKVVVVMFEKFPQLQWVIPTGARVVFGVIFLLEGTQKIFGWWGGSPTGSGHPEPFLNWPYWWAGVLESIVGILLVAGLWTRIAAIIGAGAMAYAYFFTHLPVHWEPMQNGGAFAATLCWGFLLLAVTAENTRFSLDCIIRNAQSKT